MMNSIKAQEKQGIALVIVLGFLSIMLILAVAFAVSMRTERLAARNHLDVIKARFLVQVALARTLDDIDQEIGNRIHPWSWSAYSSSGGNGAPSLLDGLAWDCIPASMRASAQVEDSSVAWRDIVVDTTNTIGRYAFLAVDCSGLLDINAVGESGTARGYGLDPREMQIDSAILSEISSAANFYTGRTELKRFETLPELWRLGIDRAFMQAGVPPTHAFVYSRFPQGQYMVGANVQNSVYIGGSESSVMATQQAPWYAISRQFESMGLDLATAQTAARNVIDYLDADYEPGNGAGLLDFCTEPVPMINEIVITNTITAGLDGADDVYVNRLDITVELFFPFAVFTNQNDYTVEAVLWTVAGTPNFSWPQPPVTVRSALTGPWNNTSPYTVVNLTAPLRTYLTPSVTPAAPTLPGVLLTEIRVRQGNLNPNEVLVDRVAQFGTPWSQLATIPVIPGTNIQFVEREANDPRINWQWGNTIHWQATTDPAGHTLSLQNTRASFASDPTADGRSEMYVRNTDSLTNVGELGFLLCAATPWHTIRLLDPGALPVLDRFTTTTNPIAKGLVNPNTLSTNALATALMSCPPERWPGEGAVGLTSIQSLDIARQIIQATTPSSFTNVSDIARVGDAGLEAAVPAAFDQMQKEAIVRNTAGLLSARQNLFTIVLLVQGLNNGVVTAEQKALVVVWRDPFPDPSGRHPMFVRYFRWLTDKCS